MPAVSTIKPEPSELVLRGCSSPPLSPPLELPPGPPRRFLKKSSKNSSNGEPGGNCGIAPPPSPPPPLASTVCDVEMLTTASITFSAISAIPSGPRAKAGADNGADIRMPAAPRQIAASKGRRRWFKAGIAPVISGLFLRKAGGIWGPQCARTGLRRKHLNRTFRSHQWGRLRQKPDAADHDGVDPAAFARVRKTTALVPDRPYQDQS